MNDIINKLVDAQMQDYFDGAYIDHGDARDQLMRFAAQVAAAQRDASAKACMSILMDYSGFDDSDIALKCMNAIDAS